MTSSSTNETALKLEFQLKEKEYQAAIVDLNVCVRVRACVRVCVCVSVCVSVP